MEVLIDVIVIVQIVVNLGVIYHDRGIMRVHLGRLLVGIGSELLVLLRLSWLGGLL